MSRPVMRAAPIFAAPSLAFALACASIAHAAAPSDCWSLRKHGQNAEAQTCFETLTRSTQAYDRAEGYWGLEQWDQANSEFRIATSAVDAAALYKVRWGMLLHERFNEKDASDLFQE